MGTKGRTWKRADKSILETAVNRVKCGENVLGVCKSVGLSYGQLYRAYKKSLIEIPSKENMGEESSR